MPRITNQEDDCPVPCDIIMAQIGAKESNEGKNKTYGEVTLYFPARVIQRDAEKVIIWHVSKISINIIFITYFLCSEEMLFYTVLSLLAEIGGYIGLLGRKGLMAL